MAATKNVQTATDGNFESDILKADKPTLVDFWAEWCGPCKILAPVIDAVADEMEGKIGVYKLNVDENPTIPTQYSVRGIPTLILFKDGNAVGQLVGNQPKEAILEMINKQL